MQFDPFPLLKEFREKFDASTDPKLWAKLVEEETRELIEAMEANPVNIHTYMGNVLKESADTIYVLTGWAQVVEEFLAEPRTEAESDEALESLSEHIFLAAQHALETVSSIVGAYAIQEAIETVHKSNLTKLGDDGKPVRREDGKIMKGPHYKPANMLPLATKVVAGL